ncbi:serine hydrolase domain-containing protein [Pedobacter montanisoli]|uniref:Beta-lactamase family protein n=1 Tax=Pedobacter montanisoli TaxID=2923277 RepID=A0ABS9ZXW5_9SPHI|nr:serine hydrolase domain-containing protein [Pedobacter montanisoli]MCJ0743129.1 beta-lactamase family protein [Pedobacter montanisoli]
MKSICFKIFAVFIILAQYCNAQQSGSKSVIKSNNPLRTPLDSLVQRAAEHYLHAPATVDLSIGIVKDGVQHQYSFHRGEGNLIQNNTYFGLGSVAKTFAGIMLAQAVVEKKVKLSDDIRKYLPGNYPNLQYKGHPVRLVDLANHTSALPAMSRDYSDKYLDSISKLEPKAFRAFYSVYTADSLFKDMHHFTLDTIPGTKYRYNGNAMMVLIAILQRVYHMPYEQLVTSFLKKQIGIADTKTRLTANEEKRLLAGYDENGKAITFIPDNGFRAAPSMFSTPADMLKYASANLSRKNAAINLSHKITFTKPDGTYMGLSWMLGKEDNGLPFIMHTGRDGFGFSSLCYLYPDHQTAIIILVNDSTGQERVADLKNELVSHILR